MRTLYTLLIPIIIGTALAVSVVGYHDAVLAATPVHVLGADDIDSSVRTRGTVVFTSDIQVDFESLYNGTGISKELFFDGGSWCVVASESDDEKVKAFAIVNYDDNATAPEQKMNYVVEGDLVYYSALSAFGVTYKFAYINAADLYTPWLWS